jgi:nucleotide-binding universal stress UspA family protein
MREWVEDSFRERLNRLVAPEALNRCNHEALVAYGDPAEEIVAAAESASADLIVLGTGKQGLGADHAPWRTLSHVVRSAYCPVLNVGANPIQ